MNPVTVLLILAFTSAALRFGNEDNDVLSAYNDVYGENYEGCLLAPMCDKCPEGMYLEVDENQCLTCECFDPCADVSCEYGCEVKVSEVTPRGDPIYVAECQSQTVS
ncbi:hypothetical protein HELRODRAFT_159901 [Helobdella robusta]|uniref:Antistasin-like domain-containing protein n=1 Tax=Helobdella robusta TaxID=6412 RepID=T1EPJ0_HELRO|nr:hypothetical protein HELRODRAFT_159901 [Helobdella robusta]ESO05825.1 hypothetical protein HELRODRAFT_159901 [Helobdella robusta]